MTPPGVFFLAIFQQTANLKQIYLYDSAICQQLHFDNYHFFLLKYTGFRGNQWNRLGLVKFSSCLSSTPGGWNTPR